MLWCSISLWHTKMKAEGNLEEGQALLDRFASLCGLIFVAKSMKVCIPQKFLCV